MFTDIRRLLPHEADDLDVILLGHSMGGLMAADVALLQIGTKPKHRILGLVNFDTPFLGLHPHVFSFGIGSLFQKTDEISGNGLADEEQKRIFETVYSDPNFNPPDIPDIPDLNTTPQLRNDARLSERGLIKHGKHHFQKRRAEKKKREEECGGKSKISSLVAPMKFASGVNNKSELRLRYQRLQELENAAYNARRLRFVNYYTSSTGRPKTKGTSQDSSPLNAFF
jgi:pimeloyl-ACP methyl ester carboxylesterase